MEKIRLWLDAQRPLCFEWLRIYLGFGLVAKGVYFLTDREFITKMLPESPGFDALLVMIAHYVPLAHLTGGLMMIAGLATRSAALIQIPILAGAVFFVHFKEGVFTTGQNLEFSAFVLFCLILVFIHGSGRWSLDARFAEKAA
jgi:uncharacterized membrane protein YphA (DoxX/SURF4 family)